MSPSCRGVPPNRWANSSALVNDFAAAHGYLGWALADGQSEQAIIRSNETAGRTIRSAIFTTGVAIALSGWSLCRSDCHFCRKAFNSAQG
jgi:hypothetical protein